MASHQLNTEHPALRKLNDAQIVFVTEYCLDFNALRAAKEAGYSEAVATSTRLLRQPKIKRAINALVQPRLREADLTAENLLRQLRSYVFSNIIPYLDQDGRLICPPQELPVNVQECIESYEVDIKTDKEGCEIGRKYKVKLVDKMASLELAMKYLNMFAPQEVRIGFDWESFARYAQNGHPDQVEAELLRLESEVQDEDE